MIFYLILLFLAVQQNTDAQSNLPSFQLNPAAPPPDTSTSSRFNYFDLELLQAFDDKQNYFISPASIKATLGMILEGARGSCAEEIRNAIRIPDPSITRAQLEGLLYDLNAKSGSTLVESANAAFISNVFRIVPEFQKNLRQYYKADVRSVDFSNVEAATNLINNWVRNATHNQINDIVTPENFNSDATLVITNALYFRGLWRKKFDENSTSIKCFHTRRNSCVDTKMMQTVDNFNYKFIDDIDAQVIQLLYGDGKYAMLVVLPSEKQTVEGVARDFQHHTFSSIVNKLQPAEVLVNMPRFDIDYTGDIVSVLQSLGIKEIFQPQANLSGIIERGQIRVNNIVHKAKIEVNEEGTTASAATGVIVIPLMGSSMPRFVADKPFLFFIYHVETNNILFEGRFNEPVEVYDELFGKPQQQTPPPRQQQAPPTRQQQGSATRQQPSHTLKVVYNQQAQNRQEAATLSITQSQSVYFPIETKTGTNTQFSSRSFESRDQRHRSIY